MKEKGFTLVELLAVIVILAVISLIATPMVLGVIEKSKKSAAIESANGIMDAAEKNMIESMLNGESKTRYDLSTDTSLSYKGEKPESGILLIDEKGKMSIKAKINGYCVMKKYNESTPNIVDNSICEGNYKEEILNGTDPVLKDKLVPVTIKDNGEVTYADITTEWYDYENKIWANAVILVDSPSKAYIAGDTILESDIESYFVWIPKYRYKLWDLGNYDSITDIDESKVHSIDIIFGTTNTDDTKVGECETPLISGESGNCEVGDYMTHPAFITMNTTGLWVGKFETGYKGATSTSAAQINSDEARKIIIKPNVYSWRNITVGNIFTAAYNYERNLDSHMMKNTEWGAVAYLSHSIYGIKNEITINNCSSYITGIGADTVSDNISSTTCTSLINKWNGSKGKLASTTGNMTGIYDMSGGTAEYMSSYIDGQLGSSGLSQIAVESNLKYFDLYNSSNSKKNYVSRILGDATGEMGPFYNYSNSVNAGNSWYNDLSGFVVSWHPWFQRGGGRDHEINASQFSFFSVTGEALNYIGFRLVLAP